MEYPSITEGFIIFREKCNAIQKLQWRIVLALKKSRLAPGMLPPAGQFTTANHCQLPSSKTRFNKF
jgi:hypothetical protein